MARRRHPPEFRQQLIADYLRTIDDSGGGTFRFGQRLLFLATPLEGYDVGLDEVDDGIWSIYFCNVMIARFDERKYVIRS